MSTTATPEPLALPKTVTVRSEELIAAFGLIEAYADVCAEIAGRYREDFDCADKDLPDATFPPLDCHEDAVIDFIGERIEDARKRYEPRIRELLQLDATAAAMRRMEKSLDRTEANLQEVEQILRDRQS